MHRKYFRLILITHVLLNFAGFPPIREFRGKFEDFFQSGKSGESSGFQPKSGKKISNQGTFFPNHFQTF